MKPRIWIIDGLWVCKRRGTRTGYGYAPAFEGAKAAYWEWKRVNRL